MGWIGRWSFKRKRFYFLMHGCRLFGGRGVLYTLLFFFLFFSITLYRDMSQDESKGSGGCLAMFFPFSISVWFAFLLEVSFA